MSSLKVDNITGRGSTGFTGSVKSEGGNTTTDLQQGLAKAWFNLNAATPALRDSFNIGSITDEGEGKYQPNFTSAMSSGDYSITGTNSTKGSGDSYSMILTTGDEANTYGLHSTASFRVTVYANNFSGHKDPSMLQANVNGDLA